MKNVNTKTTATATMTKVRDNVYRLKLGAGQSFQIEVNGKTVDIFKFSSAQRRFKFVGEASSLKAAESDVRSGKYAKLFAKEKMRAYKPDGTFVVRKAY